MFYQGRSFPLDGYLTGRVVVSWAHRNKGGANEQDQNEWDEDENYSSLVREYFSRAAYALS